MLRIIFFITHCKRTVTWKKFRTTLKIYLIPNCIYLGGIEVIFIYFLLSLDFFLNALNWMNIFLNDIGWSLLVVPIYCQVNLGRNKKEILRKKTFPAIRYVAETEPQIKKRKKQETCFVPFTRNYQKKSWYGVQHTPEVSSTFFKLYISIIESLTLIMNNNLCCIPKYFLTKFHFCSVT